MSNRKVIIDTDTASDDAVALIMALRNPKIDVIGITTVAGNCPIPEATQNALFTVELVGSSVDVYAGATAPLSRTLETAQHVHGADGMGDIGLHLKDRKPHSKGAVDYLVETIRDNPGEVELIAIGPLTNIALALQAEPRIAQWVKRFVIMGGTAVLPGNITPVAEFNIWADPEAAKIVFNSGLRVEMVGWDISIASAIIDDELAAELRTLGPIGELAIDIQVTLRKFCSEVSHFEGFDLPDPIAMAVLIDSDIVEREANLYVDVIDGDSQGRGQTIVDTLSNYKKEPNCRVIYAVSRERFIEQLKEALA
jgi:purine nucleosidase